MIDWTHFGPKTGFRADEDVADAIQAADVILVAIGVLDHGEGDAGVEHVSGEPFPVLVGRPVMKPAPGPSSR